MIFVLWCVSLSVDVWLMLELVFVISVMWFLSGVVCLFVFMMCFFVVVDLLC